jgi:hypothetical protein
VEAVAAASTVAEEGEEVTMAAVAVAASMVAAATAVAAFTAADRPTAAIVAACPGAPDAPEASAEFRRPAVPDRHGPGLGKAEVALVTPPPDGIRSPDHRMEDQKMEDQKMEDQGTAGASRRLTAPAWRQLMAQARLPRTAASPMGSGTASETPAARLGPRRTPGSQRMHHSSAAA